MRVLGLAALLFLVSLPADASLLIHIDKTQQRMSVSVDGVTRHQWAVSTGREGFGTPNGTFRPQRMARTWFSRKYYNSPMPHSIFFHGGYAIHGTNYISRLGGTASHGCVRLHPGSAATLFSLVQQHGAGNTKIVVSGTNPPSQRVEVAARDNRARFRPGMIRSRDLGEQAPSGRMGQTRTLVRFSPVVPGSSLRLPMERVRYAPMRTYHFLDDDD